MIRKMNRLAKKAAQREFATEREYKDLALELGTMSRQTGFRLFSATWTFVRVADSTFPGNLKMTRAYTVPAAAKVLKISRCGVSKRIHSGRLFACWYQGEYRIDEEQVFAAARERTQTERGTVR